MVESIFQGIGIFILKVVFFPMWLAIIIYDELHANITWIDEEIFFIINVVVGVILNILWFKLAYKLARNLGVENTTVTITIWSLIIVAVLFFVVPFFVGYKDEDGEYGVKP